VVAELDELDSTDVASTGCSKEGAVRDVEVEVGSVRVGRSKLVVGEADEAG